MHNDRTALKSILESIDKILKYSSEYNSGEELFNDQETFDACMMNFIVIGEMVNRLTPDLILSSPKIPWNQMRGFRNIIAHDYFGIDADEVWDIIEKHLPDARHQITNLIESL